MDLEAANLLLLPPFKDMFASQRYDCFCSGMLSVPVRIFMPLIGKLFSRPVFEGIVSIDQTVPPVRTVKV